MSVENRKDMDERGETNMPSLQIWRADDTALLARCLKIRNAVFTVEKGVPEAIEVDAYDCLRENCDHFLIRYDEQDIGAIRCLKTKAGTIRIQRFCFFKAYRGLGLGKAVMESLEEAYREVGAAAVELDAKYAVSGFYEKCGYQKVSGVFIEAGIEHVKMIKAL